MSASNWRVAAIALGANLGEPERTFKRALSLLEKDGDVTLLRRSHWHGTEAVGGPEGQPAYLNGAALVETTLGAHELLERLHGIESHLGRDRATEPRFGPRILDLDLLYTLDGEGAVQALREDGLILPHPRMEERGFVLEPLVEVAPQQVLPRSGRTVQEQFAYITEKGGLARLDTVEEARTWCRAATADGGTLGFLPTMGALHGGHLELVRRAAQENDRVCVSIFVNPLQFNDPGDLERYPRDFAGDAAMLAGVGCSMVFTGTLEGFFPTELVDGELPDAALKDPGGGAVGMEGTFRPGHFAGVATIVDRLFDVVEPTRGYFGAKDFQQCLVVEDVAKARGGRPEIVRCDIVREASGLAMSSRNQLLSDQARVDALVISAAMRSARDAWAKGLTDVAELTAILRRGLDSPALTLEYAEIRDAANWTAGDPVGELAEPVALVAAVVGGVRLIDNMEFSAPA